MDFTKKEKQRYKCKTQHLPVGASQQMHWCLSLHPRSGFSGQGPQGFKAVERMTPGPSPPSGGIRSVFVPGGKGKPLGAPCATVSSLT